ncbi:hypothetical protein Syun_026046 [Stephania yunnanensis]|uniref:peptidylprolyl isomerase n=1 Tax=Stephania yunnanensis TaxID=152371 RepID=A0AAP0HWC0_9MAGN
MDEIDESLVPPETNQEEEFRPYFPEKAEDEGVVNKQGLKKKLVKVGEGWEVPDQGDEITVNFTGAVVGGAQFASSGEGKPSVCFVGKDNVLKGCEDGLITMRKGEISIFTVPPALTQGIQSLYPDIPQDATLQFQVELVSWYRVVDVNNDGGVVKKIVHKSELLERPERKDEVTVKYEVKLEDGSLVAKSPEEGVEFLVSDGRLCPALAAAVVTMRKGEQAILRVEPQYAFGNAGRPAQDGLSAVPPNAVIIITLELVAYKLLEYITDDKLVIKKITSCGEAFEKPNTGATAQIRYIGKLSDGTIFDKKGLDGMEPFEFTVDYEQIVEGLDMAVATMKRKEVALVIVGPGYGYGSNGTKTELAVVPAQSTLYYEVEMVGFTKFLFMDHIAVVLLNATLSVYDSVLQCKFPPNTAHCQFFSTQITESWDMNPEQKLEYAAKRKEEGNAYFKAGKYRRASLRYDMAVKYVEFESTFDEEQKKLGKFYKVSCNLNNAACKLKMKDYKEAANLCSKALKLEPTNVKALFRRAQAYMENLDLDLAALDLKKANEIDPSNGDVTQQLQRLQNMQSYYDKKESKLYVNMIEKLKI